jgi:hypothetical protein
MKSNQGTIYSVVDFEGDQCPSNPNPNLINVTSLYFSIRKFVPGNYKGELTRQRQISGDLHVYQEL